MYFRAPAEYLVYRDLAPIEKGEYRGASTHYCVLPPSLHPDGTAYEWSVALPQDGVPFIEDVVAGGLFPVRLETQKAQGSPTKSQVVSRYLGDDDARRRLSPSATIAVEDAIARTLPSAPGTRRRKLLELARILKFHPEFAGIPASEIGFLRTALKRWWKLAKPHTSGTHPDFHRTWQDFVFAWEEARVPMGATMWAFLEKANSQPAPKRAIELYGEGSLRALLASLCQVLQQHADNKPFPLSGRVVGPLLGVSDTQAWRWLKTLEKDRLIKAARTHPQGRRLATEYRYVGG